jgi:hypothetical protein
MFRLDAPLKDGKSTLRRKYESVARQSGVVPPELRDCPEPPRDLQYLFDWFSELSATRSSGFGLSALSYVDIDAWARLTRRVLRPWEVRALRDLDTIFLSVRAEKANG